MRRDVVCHLEEVLPCPVAAGIGAEPDVSLFAVEPPESWSRLNCDKKLVPKSNDLIVDDLQEAIRSVGC